MNRDAWERAYLRVGPVVVVAWVALGAWFWFTRPQGGPQRPAQARSTAVPQSATAP